jgi:hypothetical protein
VHEHFAIAGPAHDGAEQLEVFVGRLLPVDRNIDVRGAGSGDELAFLGDGALARRRCQVHDEPEALLAERRQRRGRGLTRRVQALGHRDVICADLGGLVLCLAERGSGKREEYGERAEAM